MKWKELKEQLDLLTNDELEKEVIYRENHVEHYIDSLEIDDSLGVAEYYLQKKVVEWE